MEAAWKTNHFWSAAVLPLPHCFFWLCSCSWHSHFSFITQTCCPTSSPSSARCWEGGHIYGWRGENACSKNGSLKQKRISCSALFLCCKKVGKMISSIEEDASQQAEGKGAIRGLCWQCQLMGKMKVGFAPGSIVGLCHAFHFSYVPVWPHALQPEWGSSVQCFEHSRSNVLGNKCCREELPASQQHCPS